MPGLDITLGSPTATNLQTSIQGKLADYGYSTADDSVMAEFVTVMVANKKNKDQINSELCDLIGPEFDPNFTMWLFEEINNLEHGNNLDQVGDVDMPQPQSIETIDSRTDDNRMARGQRLFGSALRDVQRRGPKDVNGGGGSVNGSSRPRRTMDGSQRQHPYGSNANRSMRGQNQMMMQHQQKASIFERAGVMPNQQAHYNPAFFQGGVNVDEIRQARNGNIVLTTEIPRCRHWPHCSLGQHCRFGHPSEVCPAYPACPNSAGTCPKLHPGEDMPVDQVPKYIQSLQQHHMQVQQGHHMQVHQGHHMQVQQGQHMRVQPMQNQVQSPLENQTRAQSDVQMQTQTRGYPNFPQPAGDGALTHTNSNKGDVPTKPEISESCKFGLKCANPYCRYSHPTPAATAESALVLSEEPCDQGAQCKDAECVKAHPSPSIVNGSAQSKPIPSGIHHGSNKVPEPCRFGNDCTRPGCYYIHPWEAHIAKSMGLPMSSVPCRFGISCAKGSACPFYHYRPALGTKSAVFAQGDKHISDRAFSLPENEVENLSKDNREQQLEHQHQQHPVVAASTN